MTMEKLLFKTEEFEGPLDLLLFLIQKHKLDICDIEISALLEQYLTYIRSLEEQDLEVASEFLEMASRLVYIKTVMLLPRHEEEGLQLKTELQGELLEYQVCRQVAAQLGARNRMYLQFVRAPVKIEADNTYRLTHRRTSSTPPTRTRPDAAAGGCRPRRRRFRASCPGGWCRSEAASSTF